MKSDLHKHGIRIASACVFNRFYPTDYQLDIQTLSNHKKGPGLLSFFFWKCPSFSHNNGGPSPSIDLAAVCLFTCT